MPMSFSGFWNELPRPIIGLAPMDGVSDAACRFIAAKYGQPAVVFTEFTAVEGLRAGAERLLQDFLYHPLERPAVAQVFGADPEAFVGAAAIASELGFDGIDINMGCPAKNVTQRGAGAALIADPERARQIILKAREGTERWAAGESLKELGVRSELLPLIAQRRTRLEFLEGKPLPRRALPVSVKTRIGYMQEDVETWMEALLPVRPAAITVHGRTLKQLYAGEADWDAIARATRLVKSLAPETIMLGNGDVKDLTDGLARANAAGTDGFLIGRAAIGNPWIFQGRYPAAAERIAVAREHARYLNTLFDGHGFLRFRKHLLEYTKSIPGGKEIRRQLATVHTLEDTERLLTLLADHVQSA